MNVESEIVNHHAETIQREKTVLNEKIAKEFLKKSAELQHLRCSCDGCAKRLAEVINAEVKVVEDENTTLKTTLQEVRDELRLLKGKTIEFEPGTTLLAGLPIETDVVNEGSN